MTNYKAQMSNQAQNPKYKKIVLAFNLPAKAWQAGHLDFICYLDFDIWNLFSIWCLEFRIWRGATVGSSSMLSHS
jgi:hypothetical protein